MEKQAWGEDRSRTEGPRSTRSRRTVQGGFVVCLSPVGGVSGELGGEGKECLIEAGGGGVLRRGSGDEAVGGLGVKRKDPPKTV